MKTLKCNCGGSVSMRMSTNVAPSWDGQKLYCLECDKCHNHTSWAKNQKWLHDIWKKFYGKEVDE